MEHTRLEISISALEKNAKAFRKILQPHSKLFSVVKSNAYGHGMTTATYLESVVDGFCVVNVAEGVILRQLGIQKRILVVGITTENDLWQVAQKFHLELAVTTTDFLPYLSPNLPALAVHIKLNTGLNRLGIQPHMFSELFTQLSVQPLVKVVGMYSHLADAENPASQQTYNQLQVFQKTIDSFPEFTKSLDKHIAASAATILFPQAHYDIVRVGMSCYGIWPSQETKEACSAETNHTFTLQPALKWITEIIDIQELPTGALVGYGGTYRTRRPSRIATVPIGYYESVSRYLSNKGNMSIRSKIVPIVGNVCMNMTMLDITAIPEAKVGDEVVFIDNNPEAMNSAEKLSDLANTIPYTLLSTIQPHIPRIYVA